MTTTSIFFNQGSALGNNIPWYFRLEARLDGSPLIMESPDNVGAGELLDLLCAILAAVLLSGIVIALVVT